MVLPALAPRIVDQPIHNLTIRPPQLPCAQDFVLKEINLVGFIDRVIDDPAQPIGQADPWLFADILQALA
jgi:hypothetical protein